MFKTAFGLAAISAFAVSALCGCASAPAQKHLSSTEKARLMVEIANGALVEGDPTGALQSLFAAEKEDDSLPELHHSKALAYAAKHDYDTAIVSARRALQLKPDYPDAQNTLGRLLMESGKSDEAIAPLTAAAKNPVYRESYKAWTNLGILHYRRSEYDEAQGGFDRAIESSPQLSCIAYYYRGHLDLRASRFKDAIRDYESATRKFCATLTDAQLAVGIAYQRDRQYDKARKKFLEVMQNYPNSKLAEQAIQRLKELPN